MSCRFFSLPASLFCLLVSEQSCAFCSIIAVGVAVALDRSPVDVPWRTCFVILWAFLSSTAVAVWPRAGTYHIIHADHTASPPERFRADEGRILVKLL